MYQYAAMSPTRIAPRLLLAYHRTRYAVRATPPFDLKIGATSAALRQWMDQHRCHCAALITACNPYSQVLEEAENASRQRALGQAVAQRGLPCVDAVGQPLDGNWLPEASCLVGGLSLDDACALGRQFEQNALVWCGADTLAQLILLR